MAIRRIKHFIIVLIVLIFCSSVVYPAGLIDVDDALGSHRPCFVVCADDDYDDCGVKSTENPVRFVINQVAEYPRAGFVEEYEGSSDHSMDQGKWDPTGDCTYWADENGSAPNWNCLVPSRGCKFFSIEYDAGAVTTLPSSQEVFVGNRDDCAYATILPGETIGNAGGSSYETVGYTLKDTYEDTSWIAGSRYTTQDFSDLDADSNTHNSFCAWGVGNSWNSGWQYSSPSGGYICMINEWARCSGDARGKVFLVESLGNDEISAFHMYKCKSNGVWDFIGGASDADGDGYLSWSDSSFDVIYGATSGTMSYAIKELKKDCKPIHSSMYPGAPENSVELCSDGYDNDCDGDTDAADDDCDIFVDKDGDGFSISEGDCNDGPLDMPLGGGSPGFIVADCNPDTSTKPICIYPKGIGLAIGGTKPPPIEYCDGVDNDCDGYIDEYCEGDYKKEHCENAPYGYWFGTDDVGICCGDDYFVQGPDYYSRITSLTSIPDKTNYINKKAIVEETFIMPHSSGAFMGACFNGFAYRPGSRYDGDGELRSTINHFPNKLNLFNEEMTGETELLNVGGSIIKPRDRYNKLVLELEVNSETDVDLEVIGYKEYDNNNIPSINNDIVTDGNQPLSLQINTLKNNLLDASDVTEIVFSTKLPSTEGKTKYYEIEFSIPTKHIELDLFQNLFSPALEYKLEVNLKKVQQTADPLESLGLMEKHVSIEGKIRRQVMRTVLYSPEEQDFYSCKGVMEDEDIGDASAFKATIVPDVILRNVYKYPMTQDDTITKPPYSTAPTGSAIPAANRVEFLKTDGSCYQKHGWVCQVNGQWEEDRTMPGVGTILKSLPYELETDEDMNTIEVLTGDVVFDDITGDTVEPIVPPTTPTVTLDTMGTLYGSSNYIEIKPIRMYSSGCCAEDACWNGHSCSASMQMPLHGDEEPQIEHDEDSWLCVGGDWKKIARKIDQYYHLEGWCPEDMCFLNAGPPQIFNPTSVDPNNICYKSGLNYYDYTCVDGNWTTRTLLLATHMISMLPDTINTDDYTLSCHNYKKALNDVYYKAVVPPHHGTELSPEIVAPDSDTSPYLITPSSSIDLVLESIAPANAAELSTFFNVGIFGEEWPLVNNFCILTYDEDGEDKVMMGVSANNPVWSAGLGGSPEGLLKMINNSQATTPFTYYNHCAGAFVQSINDTGEKYYGCAGDNYVAPGGTAKVWYNPTRESLIYSPDGLSIDSTDWVQDAGLFKTLLSFPLQISTSKFDFDFTSTTMNKTWGAISQGNAANYVYLSRSGDKEVAAVFEPVLQSGNGVMSVMYRGFDYNLCNDTVWWSNFETIVQAASPGIGCGDNHCLCEYDSDEDINIISTYGNFGHGSFQLMPDMTSKLRVSSEGEGGLWNWIYDVIITSVIDLINAFVDIMGSITDAIAGLFGFT